MNKTIFIKTAFGPEAVLLRLLFCLPLFCLMAFSGCSRETPDKEVDFLVPVSVADVGLEDVEERVITTGSLRTGKMIVLEVETGGSLDLALDRSGRRITEGDRVKKGDVIAMITGEDIRLATRKRANLQRFETAREEYDAAKKLYDEGFRSRLELQKAETELENARLEYEKSLNAEERSRLSTPIDGVILRLARDVNDQNQPFANGQFVKPGFEVARIAPIDPLVADVDLVGKDMARVKEGLPARISHYAFDEQSFHGEVTRLAPVIDPVTRAMRAEVKVDNPDGLLKPGMFVEVVIIIQKREKVPVVPRDAVVERGGKRVVFVLSGQRVSMKEIETGLGDDTIVEIRKGLNAGERVVIRGMETLTDQTRVRVTGTN